MVLAVNQGVKFVNILPKHIRPQKLNCASNNVVCLFTCKICHKKYTGRTEEFRSRFTNCRCSFTQKPFEKQKNYTRVISRSFRGTSSPRRK